MRDNDEPLTIRIPSCQKSILCHRVIWIIDGQCKKQMDRPAPRKLCRCFHEVKTHVVVIGKLVGFVTHRYSISGNTNDQGSAVRVQENLRFPKHWNLHSLVWGARVPVDVRRRIDL